MFTASGGRSALRSHVRGEPGVIPGVIIVKVRRAGRGRGMAVAEISKELLARVEEIPTLPEVVMRLRRLVENPKTSAKDVTQVITLDPALTVKILRVVNSAFYGFPREVRTVTHAVMVLGFREVENIAFSVSVFDLFRNSRATDLGWDRVAFWQHSIAAGICARLMAARMKVGTPEDFYVVGLLHDIGKIVLDEFLHERFADVFRAASERPTLFLNIERERHDLDHAAIGRMVCRRWGLPDSIVAGVGGHHDEGFETTEAAIAHVADVFVRKERIGSGGDPCVPRLMKAAWERLRLRPEDVPAVTEKLHEEIGNADAMLELTRPVDAASR